MRVDRLDLLAYGPFTEKSLNLADGGSGLHLIYGDNEAGKSTSLRAFIALLFGIQPRTHDNFLHSNQQLRVGGKLTLSDGRSIEFVRRKGAKGTVLDHRTGAALDDSILMPFLPGSVDETLFKKLYGIIMILTFSFRLPVGTKSTPLARTFVRSQATPVQCFHNIVLCPFHIPGLVGIFNPENENTAVLPGKQVVEQCCAQTTDMERACGTGCKSYPGILIHSMLITLCLTLWTNIENGFGVIVNSPGAFPGIWDKAPP